MKLVLQILRQCSFLHYPWPHIPRRDIPFEITMRRLRRQCCETGLTDTSISTPWGCSRLHDWTRRYRSYMPSRFRFAKPLPHHDPHLRAGHRTPLATRRPTLSGSASDLFSDARRSPGENLRRHERWSEKGHSRNEHRGDIINRCEFWIHSLLFF